MKTKLFFSSVFVCSLALAVVSDQSRAFFSDVHEKMSRNKPPITYKVINEDCYSSTTNDAPAPNLPSRTKNLQDLGNGWYTFDLELNGRKRTFLFARYRSAGSWIVGTVTEIGK